MKRYFIGLDMGGTNLRCGAVDAAGEVLFARRGPARATSPGEVITANIVDQVRAVEAAAHTRGWGGPAAIGIAVPGPLDLRTGMVVAAPHVAAWRTFPLKKRLEDELERPVTIENDGNAWALGEFWRGAAKGCRDVVLLTLGTGVGGGLIVNGRIVHGERGMAGELGHVTVDPDGAMCDCGARGCLEAYASASGLKRLVQGKLRECGRVGMIDRFVGKDGNFAVEKVVRVAKANDRVAKEALEMAGRYLGIAIASLVNIFNPEIVVIGGGVAGALPLMRTGMMRQIRARAIGFALDTTPVVRAALGGSAGVVGAAYAAMCSQRESARSPVKVLLASKLQWARLE